MSKLVSAHLGDENTEFTDHKNPLRQPDNLPDPPEEASKKTHQPATLSLSMIVRDEEPVIGRLLKQVSPFVDEIIIVDTGSTDKTIEICESYGAKVFHFEWIDDFSAARNEALSHCTSDWIMWLDADDVLPLDSIHHLVGTKNTVLNDDLDVVYAPYHCQFDAVGNCTISVLRERLIRREANFRWNHPIHENIQIPDSAKRTQHPSLIIEHRKPDDLVERSQVRNNRILEKALEDKKSCHMLYHYAQGFFPREYQKAKTIFKECIEYIAYDEEMVEAGQIPQNKMFYDCAYYIMQCDMMDKNYDDVIQLGLEALGKECFRPQVYMVLGAAKYFQARFYDAVPFFQAALGCDVPVHIANTEQFQPWRAYDYLSLCYTGMGQQNKAIEMATKALENSPEDRNRIVHNIKLFVERLGKQDS